MTAMEPESDEEPLLTIAEVAAALRVDIATVRRWILAGILSYICLPHVGKRRIYRVKQSTLDSILARKAR